MASDGTNSTPPEVDPDHPFHKTLPPALDYLTYLTLIESHLESEPTSLSVLERILTTDAAQPEPRLLINIGWDLIATLLPYLPASRACLECVARAGNPRECVLKASEALGVLIAEWEGGEVGDTEGIEQFVMLTQMLAILHPRIRTKKPSRFVTTTVTPILRAVGATGPQRLPPVVDAALSLLRSLRPKRSPPVLPPRQPSSNATPAQAARPKAPDPEADAAIPDQEDAVLIDRVLDVALTFMVENCAQSFDARVGEEAPGFGWSAEALERFSVQMTVPGREGWVERFTKDGVLMQWRTGMLRLIDEVLLRLNGDQVLRSALQMPDEETTETELERTNNWTWSEDNIPDSPDELKLSRGGCLHALAVAFQRDGANKPTINIFPTTQALFDTYLPSSSPATVDCLLSIALNTLSYEQEGQEGCGLGDLPENADFIACLQTTSALAATATVPALRQTAHVLTSTLLRSHPEPGLRMAFIKEAIATAPFDNLKPVAVGWLKGEIIEANADAFRVGPLASREPMPHDRQSEGDSLFATPLPLHALSSVLFPEVGADVLIKRVALSQRWQTFQARVGFYLAVLNFYYLLLSAPKTVRERLDVAGLHRDADVAGAFLGGLRDAIAIFRTGLGHGEGDDKGALAEAEGEEGVQRSLAELSVVEDGLERIEALVRQLGPAM